MIPSPFHVNRPMIFSTATWLVAAAALFLTLAPTQTPADSQRAGQLMQLAGVNHIAGEAIEGGIILAQTRPDSTITLDGNAIPVAADGHFIVGFHRDSDDAMTVAVTHSDGTQDSTMLTPAQRVYDIQRIDGLKRDYVSPPQAVLDRIAADSAMVRDARQAIDAGHQEGNFIAGFDRPAEGRVTGIYGSQRILNGQPRQPHYGIDIAAPRGTPVKAPAGGQITMVSDLYFSGWTIIMTHGMGLNSAFLHLDDVSVSVGQDIKRGEVIGTVGSTGRSTGPHLDWRLDWQGRRLDPELVSRQLLSSIQN